MNQNNKRKFKWVLASLILMISSGLVGQNRNNQEDGLKALDEQYGFLGIKLETPFGSFKGLKKEDNSEKSIFKSTQIELRMDKYNLESVYLTFYKEFLTTIELETKGLINTNGLLGILQEAYGEGNKRAHFGYKWKGQKVWMNFAINETDGSGVLSIHSVPLMTKEIGENE